MQDMPHQQFQTHGLPMTTEHHAHFHTQLQNDGMFHSHQLQNYNDRQASVDQYVPVGSQQNNPQHTQSAAAAETEDMKKKGGAAASTQSNENELRQSLDQNITRTLKDVAKEVLDSERTPRAEKTKQLFAMLW
jgi:regulatory factor X